MARMMHPLHGWHVASAADDVPAMRRNGWVDDDGLAIAAKKVGLAQPAEDVTKQGDDHIALIKKVLEPLAAPVKRGPGRPKKLSSGT